MRAMFVRFVSRDGLSCLSAGGTLPVSSARFDNSRSAPDASGKADTATAEAVAGKTGTTSAHASVATNEAGTTVSTMPVSVRANRHACSRMSTTGPMPVPMPASATATELQRAGQKGGRKREHGAYGRERGAGNVEGTEVRKFPRASRQASGKTGQRRDGGRERPCHAALQRLAVRERSRQDEVPQARAPGIDQAESQHAQRERGFQHRR